MCTTLRITEGSKGIAVLQRFNLGTNTSGPTWPMYEGRKIYAGLITYMAGASTPRAIK